MAAKIGAVACTFVKGRPQGPTARVTFWAVPGFDGIGAQLLGKNRSEFNLTVVLLGFQAAVEAWIGAIEATLGTIVTVETDWGDTFDNCLIVRARARAKTPALGAGTDTRGEIELFGAITQPPAPI